MKSGARVARNIGMRVQDSTRSPQTGDADETGTEMTGGETSEVSGEMPTSSQFEAPTPETVEEAPEITLADRDIEIFGHPILS